MGLIALLALVATRDGWRATLWSLSSFLLAVERALVDVGRAGSGSWRAQLGHPERSRTASSGYEQGEERLPRVPKPFLSSLLSLSSQQKPVLGGSGNAHAGCDKSEQSEISVSGLPGMGTLSQSETGLEHDRVLLQSFRPVMAFRAIE
jgi:hypothetical protein